MHSSGAVAPLEHELAPAQPAEGGPAEGDGAEALEAPAPAPAEQPASAAEEHAGVSAEKSAAQVVTPPSTAAAPSPRLSAGSAKALLPSPPPGKQRRHVQQHVRQPVRVLGMPRGPTGLKCARPEDTHKSQTEQPPAALPCAKGNEMTVNCTSEAMLAVMRSAHEHQPRLFISHSQH